MTFWRCVGWAVVVLALAAPRVEGRAAQDEKPKADEKPKKDEVKPDVIFKHTDGEAKIFDLDLNHGQQFVVRIAETCVEAFDYSYASIKRGEKIRQEAEGEKAPLSSKDFTLVYDQQFGGYVFNITQKPGVKPGDVCEGGEKLIPVTFIVSVRQQKWNLSFSGGFTISGLTDPVFSVKTEDDEKMVIEEPDKRDSRKLGAASFVHLFHDGFQWKQLQPALGFGLGINSNNRAEYLVGAALRFGDKATLNVGRAWGSIARLPNGVTFDSPITDDNVLNNLGSRIVSRWFFALTYAFIDTRDRLLKPFAPDTGQAATPETEEEEPEGKADAASMTALQESAKAPATYAAIPEIAGVLSPAGGTARAICEATPSEPTAAKTALTVKVKGATTAQIEQMQAKSAAAVTAISAAAKKTLTAAGKTLGVTLTGVTFAACE